MASSIRFDDLPREGVGKSYRDIARLVAIPPEHLTKIMNLLCLARLCHRSRARTMA